MKPITKKPLKAASARKPIGKALPPRAAHKPAKAPKAKPAVVAPAPEPKAARAAPAAPRATLRSLAQHAVAAWSAAAGTPGMSVNDAMEALADFLAKDPKAERRPAKPTDTQANLINICTRPQGATAKELADAAGWSGISARITMTKIADRFGYILTEKPKAAGRGITFYMERNI
ncbi:MAG TPA: hypothetical protein VL574_16940 [Stellaceae bacterium]|jgi:hypothetical protein|nr:hypothetical protein [Stellaceae bacterium]